MWNNYILHSDCHYADLMSSDESNFMPCEQGAVNVTLSDTAEQWRMQHNSNWFSLSLWEDVKNKHKKWSKWISLEPLNSAMRHPVQGTRPTNIRLLTLLVNVFKAHYLDFMDWTEWLESKPQRRNSFRDTFQPAS